MNLEIPNILCRQLVKINFPQLTENLKNNLKRVVGVAKRKLIPTLMRNVLCVIGELNVLAGNVLVMIQEAKLRKKVFTHEAR